MDALRYIKGYDKYRIPNKSYEFEIFPNTTYNILNDMYPYFVDLVAKEEEIKELKKNIENLKNYKYGSYEEENEY
jgi:isochorismate hydrolase